MKQETVMWYEKTRPIQGIDNFINDLLKQGNTVQSVAILDRDKYGNPDSALIILNTPDTNIKATKKVIEYLENEISEMEKSNAVIVTAAANSPLGNSINLEQAADKHMRNCESRVAVQIWQNHRIKVLKSVLEDVRTLSEPSTETSKEKVK